MAAAARASRAHQNPTHDPSRRPSSVVAPITGHSSQLAFDAEMWLATLEAGNASPATLDNYRRTVESFERWLEDNGYPSETAAITARDVQAYVLDQTRKNSAGTARTRFGNLRAFFNWCVKEESIDLDVAPTDGVRNPKVQERPVEVLADDVVGRLLKACDGPRFQDKRDKALLSFLLDTGCRRSEVAGLTETDLDMNPRDPRARVVGKGNRVRFVPFSIDTLKALRSYLRVRRTHRNADLPQLWVTQMDGVAMTGASIGAVVGARAKEAGVGHVRAHQFRHTWADSMLTAGVAEGDLMRLGGWSSADMIHQRYGATRATERAVEAYRKVGSPVSRVGRGRGR